MNKLFTFFRESSTARFLIPMGIILIIFGVAMFVINSNNSNYIKTEAVVSKTELVEGEHLDENGNTVEATYNVYVKYTVDGSQYEKELGEFSDYKQGEKLNIYYNPSNPSEITQTKSKILPIIIIISGCASLIAGIVSGINAIKRYKKMKEQEKGWSN